MKKALTVFLATVFLFVPALCFSAYVIHLKDGREFTTDRYWEEGDQIKFERFGGEVGIPKNLVSEIEEVEDVLEVEAEKEKRVEEVLKGDEGEKKNVAGDVSVEGEKKGVQEKGEEKAGKDLPEITGAGEKKAEQEKDDKIEAILGEKKRILGEIKRFSSQFRDAKKQGDKSKMDKSWNKLLSLKEELSKLRKKVLLDYGGVLPPWWQKVVQ